MKVGTAETIDIPDEERRRRSGLISSSGPSSNGGGNDGGSGGDGPDGEPPDLRQRFNSEKLRVLTFFLLLAIMMTFGGLIAAYVVIATNGVAEWQPFNLPVQVWISTCIIIASSVAYHLGQRAVERNDTPAARKWLTTTTALGSAFISSQILAWIALTGRGFYMSGNPYAGFFYILTAVHAVHVIGGISALGSVLLRSWTPTVDPAKIVRRASIASVVGWYWHFMGVLWIILFILLGFWK